MEEQDCCETDLEYKMRMESNANARRYWDKKRKKNNEKKSKEISPINQDKDSQPN